MNGLEVAIFLLRCRRDTLQAEIELSRYRNQYPGAAEGALSEVTTLIKQLDKISKA